MADSIPDYFGHIESHLGRLPDNVTGWRSSAEIQEFSIVKIEDQPVEGSSTYLTSGISHHLLDQPSGKKIRQELIFSCWSEFDDPLIPEFVHSVGCELLEGHQAFLDGGYLGPRGPLFPFTELEVLYFSSPRYFPASFEVLDTCSPPLVMVWLVPIGNLEARYLVSHGPKSFDQLLVEQDPDMLDLERDEIEISCKV